MNSVLLNPSNKGGDGLWQMMRLPTLVTLVT
jgi:hypothetical protein